MVSEASFLSSGFGTYTKEILKRLPQKPGVYKYFDEKGDIIYVCKAKKLKNIVMKTGIL